MNDLPRRNTISLSTMVTAVALLAIAGLVVFAAVRPQVMPHEIGAFSVDLSGRTPHQRFNAERAARLLDGTIIRPGAEFSFNKTLKGWSRQRGFLKAPVSYDGILIDEYGGGVCETSTVVYNAALLAGLPIVERHQHTFAPSYVAPGRDAAVAYQNIDMRFSNPLPKPIVLHVAREGWRLICRLTTAAPSADRVSVDGCVLDRFRPPPVAAPTGHRYLTRWRLTGRDGVRIVVYRNFYDRRGKVTNRELVSDNSYQAMARG